MDSSQDIIRKLRENRILNERTDYENMSQDELIRLSKEGDQFAIKVLIDHNQDLFYRMTKKYIPEGTFDRDDILQIAEIAFWEAVQSWDGSGDFEAYAGMVIKRRLTDEYRKLDTDKARANRDTRSVELTQEGPEDSREQMGDMDKSEFDSWISQSSRSAEDEYLDKDIEEQLTKFFQEEMTELERKLIKMYLDGYKMSQIAEVTGVKYKTCENAVRRAKDKIKDYFTGMRESRKIREGKESIFSEEESRILKSVLAKIDGDMNESKEVEEHLEVSAGAGSTTSEKVAYVKKMVEKAKEDGDEHSAWDIVDFLYDSMLLDKIPLDESKKMRESGAYRLLYDINDTLKSIIGQGDYFVSYYVNGQRVDFDDDWKYCEVLGNSRNDWVEYIRTNGVVDRSESSQGDPVFDKIYDYFKSLKSTNESKKVSRSRRVRH